MNMRSLRVAGSPIFGGEITSPPLSSKHLPSQSQINGRRLSRSRSSCRVDNNNTSATDTQIMRITCSQIFQALTVASESLSGEILHQLCAELLVFSEDAIKTKNTKPLMKNVNNTIPSSPVKSPPTMEVRRVPEAINHRMAEIVEKQVNTLSRKDSSIPIKQTMEAVNLFPTKNVLDLFAKLPNDDGQYDMFLNICDPDLMDDPQQIRKNYLAFKRSDSNVPFMLFFFLCGAFFMGTGYVWSNDINTYRQYPTAILSIIFGILASFCLLWITLNRVVLLSFQYNIVHLQRYHDYVVNLHNSPYGQWPDNGAILFAALSTGFYLVNIVLMDVCDPEMVVENGLNHLVACVQLVEPPPESFVLTMISVVVLQIVARGVSRTALVCSWISCIFAVNTSIYLSNRNRYAWMDLLLLFLVCISYELERQPLRQFIKTTKAIEAGEIAAELRQQLAAHQTLQSSQALESKRSLVRHIGHEIRTPLNVVGVGVELLIKDLELHASALPDGVMDTVYGIQDASNASLEVINELLEFEKLAAGLTTLECVPTPILPFLEQAMKQHFLPARNKNISFELVHSSFISVTSTINVDPMKMATVFRNLFSNAIKFTKKDGRVTVRVKVHRPSLDGIEMLEVAVVDSGAGLSPGNLQRLFGEGVQFNANGLQGGGGSGLGLFNTKGIVELHENGKIWAESEGEGKGCTFFVQLPMHSHHHMALSRDLLGSVLLLSEEPDVKQSEFIVHKECPIILVEATVPTIVEAAWKPTILVVDDSAMNRKMLVRMLVSKGFACREAEDGVEALSEMLCKSNIRRIGSNDRNKKYNKSLAESFDMQNHQQQFAIDAVLIDFHMPRMNGPDAIVEMRKIAFNGPIIGVSGGDEKTMQQFLQAGASNVIQKPAQSDKLVGILLAGFRLVVHEETSRMPTPLNDNYGFPFVASQERITRLRNFLLEKEAVKN